jgi:hypothetical protein
MLIKIPVLIIVLISIISNISYALPIKLSKIDYPNQDDLKKLNFQAYINTVGRVNFDFKNIKKSEVTPEIITAHGSYNDNTPIYLLKGWVNTRTGLKRATGSIAFYNSGYKITTSFSTETRIRKKVNLVNLEITSSNNKISSVVKRTKDTHFLNKLCGSDTLILNNFNAFSSNDFNKNIRYNENSTYNIELSLHADRQYVLDFGNTSQFLLARINDVETIYEDQLGLTFTVKRLSFDSTLTFASAQAGTLLEDFGSYIDSKNLFSSADIFHLYTGRDLLSGSSSGVIGIAYQGLSSPPDPGVVCRYSNTLSIGATERLDNTPDGLITLTTAHEIGHNFGAEHVSSGIMSAVATDPLPDSFSSESINTITGHVENYSTCLDEITPTPTPTGTSTSTSTPTPTPISTPNNGSGSGVSGDGINPAVVVNYQVSLNRNGNFSAQIDLEEEPDEDCALYLVVGPNKNTMSWKNKIIYSGSPALSNTLSTQIQKALFATTKKGKIAKLFTSAYLICEDPTKSGASEIKRLRAENINARTKAYYGGWARYVRGLLE